MLLGNWNILTLTGKQLELVEEAKRYHLDIIGVSSAKRRGSGTVDLDGGWKLFYSSAHFSMSAQASVGILTSLWLSDCVSDSFGITDLHVEAQGMGSVIVPIADIRPQCYKLRSGFCG